GDDMAHLDMTEGVALPYIDGAARTVEQVIQRRFRHNGAGEGASAVNAVMRVEKVQRRAADRLGQRQDRIGIEIHKMDRKFIDGGELLLAIIEEMNEAFDLVAMDAKDARNAVNRRSRPHFRFILRAHRSEAKALAGLPNDRRGKPKGVLKMTEGIRRLCHIELHVHMVHLVAFPLVDARS